MGTTEPALTTADEREASPPDPETDLVEGFHLPFLWAVAGLMIAVLWVRPMVSSLWTDELGTWWVISGNAREAVTRAEAVQGQSPLYYLVAWATRLVTGPSEFGLRLPSLIFLLIAAFLIYRVATRLADPETGRIAVIVFAIWPSIAFAASDARPYALATLAAVASTWAVIRWLDSGRIWALTSYALLAAIIPYVHPIFGLVLIPQVVYAAARIREGSTRVRPREVTLAVLAIALLVAPIALELLALWRRHEDWSVPVTATVFGVTWMLVPPALVGATVVAALLMTSRLRINSGRTQLPRSTVILLTGWFLIPAAVLVGVAIVSPVRLLEARYFLCVAPAAVLLVAIGVRALEPPDVRRIVVLVFAILSVLDLASPVKSGDMRGAAALVRSVADENSVILIRSGFQESLQRSWYTDPERQGLLTAATSFYHVPGEIVPLPANLDTTTSDLARQQIEGPIKGADKVIAITLTGSSYEPWLEEYMRERGWTSHVIGTVNLFTVTEFTVAAK
jgi:hypothetical protein